MTKKTETKNEIAMLNGSTDIATRNERVGQGSQNVTADDLAIPRIKVLQALSPEVNATEAEYVTGATVGMLLNSVTKTLATSLYAINLHFSKSYVVWRLRKQGGGMFGAFDSEAEAIAELEDKKENVENFDIMETPCHLVYLINENGEHEGTALVDMPGTKRKKSKNWNTQIAEAEKAGQPRFSTIWELSTVIEKNSEGTHFNYAISKVGTAPDSIYNDAVAEFDKFFKAQEAA